MHSGNHWNQQEIEKNRATPHHENDQESALPKPKKPYQNMPVLPVPTNAGNTTLFNLLFWGGGRGENPSPFSWSFVGCIGPVSYKENQKHLISGIFVYLSHFISFSAEKITTGSRKRERSKSVIKKTSELGVG